MFEKIFSKDRRIENQNNDLLNSKDFIQINDLQKSFKVGDSMVPVLKGLDFEVERGEFIAINHQFISQIFQCSSQTENIFYFFERK